MSVVPDPNPWKIYRNQVLNSQVRDHATASRVLKVLRRAFPNDKFDVRYQGKSLSHFDYNGSKVDA